MPPMTSLMNAKDCMDTLVNLYEKQAPSQKRTLKHNLKYLKMKKGESVASFCSRIAQIRDQLLVTGVTVDDDDLVHAIFYGLSSSWETFLSSVNGREIQPMFERLWHDCLQERANKRRALIFRINIQGKEERHFPERLSEEAKHQRYIQMKEY